MHLLLALTLSVAELRAMGQPGVDALMAVRENTPEFHAKIDAVCKQRDCAWSGLYWYTDLEAAKRAAKESHKPILSLRLLGNLDEELSCANSRYFRALLYANRDISAYLRANYVLHWQSVRPVPVMTIDFGDGRKLTRTVTGNSIHYILDEDGVPLDAIPGLWSPPAFLALLRDSAEEHRDVQPPKEPLATKAGRLAVTKNLAETKLVALATKSIDDNSIAMIRAMRGDQPIAPLLRNLERTLAADERVNQQIRERIREWLANDKTDVDALNDRVYAELFLTPNDDPWMGLVDDDVFTAMTSAAEDRRTADRSAAVRIPAPR